MAKVKKKSKNDMPCNKPTKSWRAGKKKVVKACSSGKEKIVHFGDSSMTIKKNQPKRRKSFRARHKCDEKKSKLTASYWSCKAW